MKVQDPGPVWWVKLVAVLSLIGGFVVAIALWGNSSEPVFSDDLFGPTERETNGFMVTMGFVSLLQGILVWAVLMVYAAMAENVAVMAANSEAARRATRKAASD